jgi:hypothetical protein
MKSLCLSEPGAWLSRFSEGFIVLFAGSQHTASEYSSFLPGKYIHIGLREDIIQNYWKWCDQQREEKKPVPPCLFIFDDVLVTTSSKKYNVTRTSNNYWLGRLWQEGRHQNISCVLLSQSLSIALPYVRCSDLFICFPSAFYAYQDVKMLTENYMPCPKKTAEWISDQFTQYEALVCEYWRQKSRQWQTRIFWYRVSTKIAKYDADAAFDREPRREQGTVPGVRAGHEGRVDNKRTNTREYVHPALHSGEREDGSGISQK